MLSFSKYILISLVCLCLASHSLAEDYWVLIFWVDTVSFEICDPNGNILHHPSEPEAYCPDQSHQQYCDSLNQSIGVTSSYIDLWRYQSVFIQVLRNIVTVLRDQVEYGESRFHFAISLGLNQRALRSLEPALNLIFRQGTLPVPESTMSFELPGSFSTNSTLRVVAETALPSLAVQPRGQPGMGLIISPESSSPAVQVYQDGYYQPLSEARHFNFAAMGRLFIDRISQQGRDGLVRFIDFGNLTPQEQKLCTSLGFQSGQDVEHVLSQDSTIALNTGLAAYGYVASQNTSLALPPSSLQSTGSGEASEASAGHPLLPPQGEQSGASPQQQIDDSGDTVTGAVITETLSRIRHIINRTRETHPEARLSIMFIGNQHFLSALQTDYPDIVPPPEGCLRTGLLRLLENTQGSLVPPVSSEQEGEDIRPFSIFAYLRSLSIFAHLCLCCSDCCRRSH